MNRAKQAVMGLIGTAALIGLPGCSQDTGPDAEQTPTASSQTATATRPSTTQSSSTAASPTSPNSPASESDSSAQAQARAQALRFMKAYARPPAKKAKSWWPTMRPYLTDEAASTVQIGPEQVPFRTIDESTPPVVVPGGGDDFVVTVRTDTGDWMVTLTPAYGRLLVSELPTLAGEQPAPTTSTTHATPTGQKA